jgi:hypothetical protein
MDTVVQCGSDQLRPNHSSMRICYSAQVAEAESHEADQASPQIRSRGGGIDVVAQSRRPPYPAGVQKGL